MTKMNKKTFTLSDFTESDKAKRLKIANIPNAEAVQNLKELYCKILQPLTLYIPGDIHITSGYRSKELNAAIRGASKKSSHCLGEAVDFTAGGMADRDLVDFIIKKDFDYDQIILEYPPDGWVHVSHKRIGKNRKDTLVKKIATDYTRYKAEQ